MTCGAIGVVQRGYATSIVIESSDDTVRRLKEAYRGTLSELPLGPCVRTDLE